MFGRRSRRPRPPRSPAVANMPMEEVHVGGEVSPFTIDEAACARRNEDAAELVDDDTMGYMVVRLKKDRNKPSGSILVSGHVRPEWRNHFRAVFDRIARHGFSS